MDNSPVDVRNEAYSIINITLASLKLHQQNLIQTRGKMSRKEMRQHPECSQIIKDISDAQRRLERERSTFEA